MRIRLRKGRLDVNLRPSSGGSVKGTARRGGVRWPHEGAASPSGDASKMLLEDPITPRCAARLLHVHISTIYRYILSGRLRAWRRVSLRYVVSRKQVLALLEPVDPKEGIPATVRQAEEDRAAEDYLRRLGYPL